MTLEERIAALEAANARRAQRAQVVLNNLSCAMWWMAILREGPGRFSAELHQLIVDIISLMTDIEETCEEARRE